MKKRIAIAAGGLALAAVVAIPVGGAHGTTHCNKLNTSIDTAMAIVGASNSGHATEVQSFLNSARGKCD